MKTFVVKDRFNAVQLITAEWCNPVQGALLFSERDERGLESIIAQFGPGEWVFFADKATLSTTVAN